MEKAKDRRDELQCTIYPLNSLAEYKYVVVCSRYQGAWLLSMHKKRSTWETQGGHIEPGESPVQAARRELYEESGVREAELYPVCDYCGYDAQSHANGVVFLAVIHHLGAMPESEMRNTALFDALPKNLTYPNVSPRLYAEAEKLLRSLGCTGAKDKSEELG